MIKMLHGLLLKLNLQSGATLEFSESGCNVVGSLVNGITSARSKTRQTNLLMQLNGYSYVNLGNKFSDPNTGQKHFWTAFERISNKKKQTNIPPIFENNCYVTNFQQTFNDYFAEQCKMYDNGSLLPKFVSQTNAAMSQINITTTQIIDIIQKYSTKKLHGCDDISVTMLQLCPTKVAVPLQLIFQKCVLTGAFPDTWKCATVVPIHKKK